MKIGNYYLEGEVSETNDYGLGTYYTKVEYEHQLRILILFIQFGLYWGKIDRDL